MTEALPRPVKGGSGNGSTPSLRILMVTNRWPRPDHHGGIFVKQLVDAVRKQGHVVDVEVVAQSRGRHDYVTAAPRVRARAIKGRYDVVHVHYGLSALAATLVSGVPRILTLYGSDINTPWQRRVSLCCSRGYAARIYVSHRLAITARDSEGIVIPNGVELDVFVPGDREAARAAIGANAAERLVLFGGSPGRSVKGWDLFIDVIDGINARGVAVKPLVLTQPGQAIDEVVRKLDAADLLLFTSRQGAEGSPAVVKEAIVMGLPVVSVDVGDVADRLEGIDPSAVIAFPGPAGLPDARGELVTRLTDAAVAVLADGRRSNGRQRAAELSMDKMADRMIELYEAAARA